MKNRAIVYIDGFNLYYGLKTKGWKKYYWLNIQRLAQNIMRSAQELVSTKYFTALVSSTPRDPDKNKRQLVYLEALGTLKDFYIYYGHYLQKSVKCNKCGSVWEIYEEKMTDVNIAIELLGDAFNDLFDTAIIISGDSDLVGLIQMIKRFFSMKRVIIAFPPERVSKELRKVADAYFTLGRGVLHNSQFHDEVQKPNGIILRRPDTWR